MEAALRPSSDTVRVIVADDEPLFVEMVRAMLTAEGIEVVGTAQDGKEAVEKTLTLTPDVTLMDISMPGLDGTHRGRPRTQGGRVGLPVEGPDRRRAHLDDRRAREALAILGTPCFPLW